MKISIHFIGGEPLVLNILEPEVNVLVSWVFNYTDAEPYSLNSLESTYVLNKKNINFISFSK